MLSHALLRPRRAAVLRPRPLLFYTRHVSTSHHHPPQGSEGNPDFDSRTMMDQLQKPLTHAIVSLGRFFKYAVIGVGLLGLSTYTAYESTHAYVEHIALGSDPDEDARKWGWMHEAERWSGSSNGGTDPALGYRGRHATRGAWMAYHWGTGEGASVIGTSAHTRPGAGGLNVIEARLEFAQDFLAMAINIAEEKLAAGKDLHPGTLAALLARHGNTLERRGSHDALWESRAQFERIWSMMVPLKDTVDAARVAVKIGDLNCRLGDTQDALVWWTRAIELINGPSPSPTSLTMLSTDGKDAIIEPKIPSSLPSDPSAQRTLSSVLVSLSAFYSTSGLLKQAQATQESALALLTPSQPTSSSSTPSPAQTLHNLYLAHRTALLSIHHAEVSYALRDPLTTSLSSLKRAAKTSERVVLTLAGLPTVHPDAPTSRIPHPPASEAPLAEPYAHSSGSGSSMEKPARALLRDARRSAAEAWNLMGVLTEQGSGEGSMQKPTSGAADKPRKKSNGLWPFSSSSSSSTIAAAVIGDKDDAKVRRATEAMAYYERALAWAGVRADMGGGMGDAGEGITEREWKMLWANYVRVRDVVRKAQLEAATNTTAADAKNNKAASV
jgi:hypothetical protein